MDVCHYCHDVITINDKIALDPKKGRAWCESCINQIRICLWRRFIRYLPARAAICKIDTFPYAA